MQVEPITDYRTASALVMKHRKPRRLTNLFLSGEELREEIAAGTLYFLEYDGGLLLYRARDTFTRLHYAIDTAYSMPTQPEGALVCEQVFRSGEQPCVPEVLAQAGFTLALERVHLARPASEPSAYPRSVSPASAADASAVMELLKESFHPVTGCLPTDTALSAACDAGNILCVKDAAGIAGVLDYRVGRTGGEIRHLAVSGRARRRGYATALVQAFFAATEGQKSTVWTGADNTAALTFYKQCGYAPDGMSSAVIWKGIP